MGKRLVRRAAPLAGAAAALFLLLLSAPAVDAHGPCTCVSPNPARAGMEVRVDGPSVRVIWNPGPHDFAGQTTPLDLASAHAPDAPSATVMRHRRPRWPRRAPRGRRFTVPRDTPPGIYFVLIYDGSEGGSHTTWDYVQIAGGPGRTGGVFAPLLAAFQRLRPVLLSL